MQRVGTDDSTLCYRISLTGRRYFGNYIFQKGGFQSLCDGVVHGIRGYQLHRATGAVCLNMGAREFDIHSGNYDEHWKWCSKEGSRFSEVAYLNSIFWLEVKGSWQCSLSLGTYIFSWKIALLENFVNITGPVSLHFEATGNKPVTTVCYF
jgi:hypothetical protein